MTMRRCALLAAVIATSITAPASADSPTLTIYTYSSFVSEWGPGPALQPLFEAQCGCAINWVSLEDGAALLSRLKLEGEQTEADIVLGLDTNLTAETAATGLIAPHDLDLSGLKLPIAWDDQDFVPYDYGYFAVVYDSETLPNPPRSLAELTAPGGGPKIILMDPRTSTPGLGFFAWVKAVYGEDWKDYWKRLEPSILTIADGWDSGYGMFTKGEAPLVLSYNTSPAYHLEYEETERFQALIFEEGHVDQIEFAGILASSKRVELAQSFMDFMLSDGFQAVIPLTNWMYPVVETELPASFRLAPTPTRILPSRGPDTAELDEWAALFQ